MSSNEYRRGYPTIDEENKRIARNANLVRIATEVHLKTGLNLTEVYDFLDKSGNIYPIFQKLSASEKDFLVVEVEKQFRGWGKQGS